MARKEHIDSIILVDVRELISSYFIKLDAACRYGLDQKQTNKKQDEYILRKAKEMKKELNAFIDKQVQSKSAGKKMLKIACPECMSDDIAYTATLENGDEFMDTFLCQECGAEFSKDRIHFEEIVR